MNSSTVAVAIPNTLYSIGRQNYINPTCKRRLTKAEVLSKGRKLRKTRSTQNQHDKTKKFHLRTESIEGGDGRAGSWRIVPQTTLPGKFSNS
jgi:hypothetical protein